MMENIKKRCKKLRTLFNRIFSDQSASHLEAIRRYELSVAKKVFPAGGRLLEIGAGAGWQAKELQSSGYKVDAIDIAESNLIDQRIWPIIDYDGRVIPFPDNSFDIVFSSNVLEHISDIFQFQGEIQRILKPEGYVVHILPTGSWRFWSNITEMLRKWRLPLIHGEHASNPFIEIYYFSRWYWSRMFRNAGWKIKEIEPIGLFYTGSSLFDSRLSIGGRKKLSVILGSSCNVYILQKTELTG